MTPAELQAFDALETSLSLIVRTIGDCQRHGWNASDRDALISCLPDARAALAAAAVLP